MPDTDKDLADLTPQEQLELLKAQEPVDTSPVPEDGDQDAYEVAEVPS